MMSWPLSQCKTGQKLFRPRVNNVSGLEFSSSRPVSDVSKSRRQEKDMTIEVTKSSTEYIMNDNGLFQCSHKNVRITPPCCNTRGESGYVECDCGGQYSFYCPDCRNKDMTDSDMERLLGY